MPPRKLPKASPRPGQAAKSKRAPSKSKLNGALIPKPSEASPTATPPSRQHALSYHYPLLLNDSESCSALLKWFQGIEEARSMPWRKRWIDPARYESSGEELAEILARRGYEVWVSEISELRSRYRITVIFKF
jgi:A/G-specific adenine glycosylase